MSKAVEFTPWPKTPHWFRDITVTEKLDGTNAAIQIHRFDDLSPIDQNHPDIVDIVIDVDTYAVFAQSRKRFISPTNDNFGFAQWVRDNSFHLYRDLGTGTHFGEWWGEGIQRNYDLDHRRFSLFNTKKWYSEDFQTKGLDVVPVLYEGPLEWFDVEAQLDDLRDDGSYASPGFMNPEGIVIYHHHANQVFKIRLEDRPAEDPPEVASVHDIFTMPKSLAEFGNLFFGGKAA